VVLQIKHLAFSPFNPFFHAGFVVLGGLEWGPVLPLFPDFVEFLKLFFRLIRALLYRKDINLERIVAEKTRMAASRVLVKGAGRQEELLVLDLTWPLAETIILLK